MKCKIVFEIVAASIAVMILASGVAVGVNAVYTAADGSESKVSLLPPAIYVPDDYSTIQAAVNATSPGDTIIVRDETYNENVKVDKRLTLRSENGSDKTIVQAANSEDHIFNVTADHVNISGFTVRGASDDTGIYIYCANNCVISNNTCSNNDYGIYLYNSSTNCISNNTANSNSEAGIVCWTSSDNSLINNRVSSNDYGIVMYNYSRDNIAANNTALLNSYGIYLARSINNYISNNNCSNNREDGIYLYDSSNNSISGNNVSNNDVCGISLGDSSNNNITGNNISNNKYCGIVFDGSNNTIIGNTFVNDGLLVIEAYQNTVEDNIVNGKPLVYLEDASDYKVEDAGQVILVNCSKITVENLDISNTSVGIVLWETEDSIISNNTVSNNVCGIFLWHSSNNNTITGNNTVSNNDVGIVLDDSSNNSISSNTVCNNSWRGIYLKYSRNNKIYFNNFINNTDNVDFSSYYLTNIWNSPLEITYTYNGTTYKSYLGNYWDDYEGTDAEGDGIGDTHYSIDSDSDESDEYPLMKPFENYILPRSAPT